MGFMANVFVRMRNSPSSATSLLSYSGMRMLSRSLFESLVLFFLIWRSILYMQQSSAFMKVELSSSLRKRNGPALIVTSTRSISRTRESLTAASASLGKYLSNLPSFFSMWSVRSRLTSTLRALIVIFIISPILFCNRPREITERLSYIEAVSGYRSLWQLYCTIPLHRCLYFLLIIYKSFWIMRLHFRSAAWNVQINNILQYAKTMI